MPSTFSIVTSMRNSGTTSTRPPIETAMTVKTKSRMEFFSSFLCLSSMCGPLRQGYAHAGITLDSFDDVVDHHQRPAEIQNTPKRADDVIKIQIGDRFDEGGLQENNSVIGA